MKKNNIGCFGYAIILLIIVLIIRYWYLILILGIISIFSFFVYKHYSKKKNESVNQKGNIVSGDTDIETNDPANPKEIIVSKNKITETNDSVNLEENIIPKDNIAETNDSVNLEENIISKDNIAETNEPPKIENNTIIPISSEDKPNEQKYKLLFETKIVGSSFHKGNIKQAIKEAKDFLPLGLYQGTSNKEIKEDFLYGEKVYEICDSDDIGTFHLVKEPENQYDKNAIAVKVITYNNDDLTIGYIPKDKTLKCSHFMSDDNSNITYNFHFGGGKYKTLSQDEFGEDKVKIKNSNYWFELNILSKI